MAAEVKKPFAYEIYSDYNEVGLSMKIPKGLKDKLKYDKIVLTYKGSKISVPKSEIFEEIGQVELLTIDRNKVTSLDDVEYIIQVIFIEPSPFEDDYGKSSIIRYHFKAGKYLYRTRILEKTSPGLEKYLDYQYIKKSGKAEILNNKYEPFKSVFIPIEKAKLNQVRTSR